MTPVHQPPRESPAALAALESVLTGSRGLLIAFSGGVDSSVLLAAAHRVLGDRAVALTADSASMPRRELQSAIDLAAMLGIRHVVRETGEVGLPAYRKNDSSRCYWCKHTLFETCEAVASELGLREIAYGYTADDVADVRPGHRAATEFGIRSPLLEAGLGKLEIRGIAEMLGLKVWDKPAAPCLSSRIPHGSDVSTEKLRRIEVMEDLLSDLGFGVFRARFDGTHMRIELPPDDIPRATKPDISAKILGVAKELSIPIVSIDLEGFRSGKLNEIAGR